MSSTRTALALLLAVVAAWGQADPRLAEFERYIKSPDAAVRMDQVERLAKVDTPEGVKLLLDKGLTDDDIGVRDRAAWALAQMPVERFADMAPGFQSSKAEVREGLCLSFACREKFGGAAPTKTIITLLQSDRSAAVRSAAAEALGTIQDRDALPALLEATGDRAEEVVISSIDALGLLKDPAAGPKLAEMLGAKTWRVQIAAVSALGRVRSKDGIGPLIEYMDKADGRSVEDARRALMKITQRTFGMKAEEWRNWWERNQESWTVPPEGKTEEASAGPPATDEYGRSKPTRYHRITTYSKRILFVIDISLSMKTPILVQEGVENGSDLALDVGVPKILLAREELKRVLEAMDDDTWFNIIAFETDVRHYQKNAVRATPGAVQSAVRWLVRQEPRGGASSGVRQSSNVDENGWIVGKTNTFGALAAAFEKVVDPKFGVREGTAPSGSRDKPKWDTCFFLSDGAPTVGVVVDIEKILEHVARWNKTARMVVHCIGMEKEQGLATLLYGLAQATGGQTVFLGR